MNAKAPGKFTISGEHSAIYGAPVLVQALDCFSTAEIQPSKSFEIQLLNLDQKYVYTATALKKILTTTRSRYGQFENNHATISRIIPKSTNLAAIVLANFLNTFQLFKNTCSLTVYSDLPMGSGLGSSSAMSVSIMRALSKFYGIRLTNQAFHDLVQETERYQSGKSSGVDSYISINSGACLYQKGRGSTHPILNTPYLLIHTGKPSVDTGAVVMHVANKFKNSTIWKDFEEVTFGLSNAIKENDYARQKELVQQNHRLLCEIDVVPKKVQAFIAQLESEGFAAKISGAGAHMGDGGGVVLLLEKQAPRILDEYSYSILTV